MSNRADNSVENANENATDDDVIDLTEEVGEEIDDFALTMPEFRVPTSEHQAASPPDLMPDDNTGKLPAEAIKQIEQDLRENPPQEDTKEMQPKFDRSDLVKTVQMDSFEPPLELITAGPTEIDAFLTDQRFAPDILVRPPRVLTKKWQDGAKTATNGVAAGGAMRLEDRSSIASTVKLSDGDSLEMLSEAEMLSESEMLDLEEPDLVIEEVKPPPTKPASQPPASARQTSPEPQRPPSDDDDLNGIVQELLEEKKQKTQEPLTPEQIKRAAWCTEVFDEEYLRTLPKALKRETEREVHFIRESLGLQSGAHILDLACGFGRHSVELAEAGFEVAGLDLSMVLLKHALAEAQRRKLRIKFIHGDMRELNFPEIFDGCFCWQTSFGYFDDGTNIEVLKGINASLKMGGRLLLDLVNRDYVIAEMPSRTWWEGIECVFLEEVEFDYSQSVLHTKRSFIYEDGSPPREYSSFIRLYSLHELTVVLAECGFKVREVSGAIYHRSNFLGPSSNKMIVLAEKVEKR